MFQSDLIIPLDTLPLPLPLPLQSGRPLRDNRLNLREELLRDMPQKTTQNRIQEVNQDMDPKENKIKRNTETSRARVDQNQ